MLKFLPHAFRPDHEVRRAYEAVDRVPEHSPLHPVYALFLFCCITSVLWQHSDPVLTCWVLGAIPVLAALAYVPYRWFGTLLRYALKTGIFIFALGWMYYRFRHEFMFDQVCVEVLCIVTLTFLTGGAKKDYGYLTFSGVFLLIYGALLPRVLFLAVLPCAFLLLALILFTTRSRSLANAPTAKLSEPFSFRSVLPAVLLQLLAAGVLFWWVFGLLPLSPTTSRGIFEVDFYTDKENMIPPDTGNWINRMKKTVSSPKAEKTVKGSGKPDVLDHSGTPIDAIGSKNRADGEGGGSAPPGEDLIFRVKSPVKLYHLARLYDAYNGSVWSVSPKAFSLYALTPAGVRTAEVISLYSIEKWISPHVFGPWQTMEFSVSGADTGLSADRPSPKVLTAGGNMPPLPFKYKTTSRLVLPEQESFRAGADSLVISPPLSKPAVRLMLRGSMTLHRAPERRTVRGAGFHGHPLLLTETVTHFHAGGRCCLSPEDAFDLSIPAGGCRVAEDVLRESRPPLYNPEHVSPTEWKNRVAPSGWMPRNFRPSGENSASESEIRKEIGTLSAIPDVWNEPFPRSHYLTLPPVSERLKRKTADILEGKQGAYVRAMALRDWLRNSFPYTLEVPKPPAGRETADYFVFELRRGHCEYFATALAVMARIAGIPSRVATGFSPGDYDTLNGVFEVRSKHAHAWTQLFIEGAGWLTFDATPPSAVPSDTTPIGIGKFRDPFGDEWRVSPPELSGNTLKFLGDALLRKIQSERENAQNSSALTRLAAAEEKLRDSVRKAYENANAKSAGKKPPVLSSGKLSMETVKKFLSEIPKAVSRAAARLFAVLAENAWITAAGSALLTAGALMFRPLKRLFRRGRLRRRARLLISRARKSLPDDPACSVRCSYLLVRTALVLAGFPRRNNMELMEYLDSVKTSGPELYVPAKPVFEQFYRMEYSGEIPDAETAAGLLEKALAADRISREKRKPRSV